MRARSGKEEPAPLPAPRPHRWPGCRSDGESPRSRVDEGGGLTDEIVVEDGPAPRPIHRVSPKGCPELAGTSRRQPAPSRWQDEANGGEEVRFDSSDSLRAEQEPRTSSHGDVIALDASGSGTTP